MRNFMIVALFLMISSISAAQSMQEQRKEMIEKLQRTGIFQKVEVPGNLPHLWIRPAFYALDFDAKQSFVNVVYSYFYTKNPSYRMVILFDSRSGKEVGEFSPSLGGLKME